MGVITTRVSRTWQPQGSVSLKNNERIIPTTVFSGGSGPVLLGRKSAIASFASGDGLAPTRYGISFKGSRATDGGLKFGQVNPLSSDSWTIIALANPGNADGVSALYSQRNGSSPYNQIDLAVNCSDSLAVVAGQMSTITLDTASAARSSKSDATTYTDGNFHVYAATRSGTSQFPVQYFDGSLIASTGAGTGTGTSINANLRCRVGNVGDYTADAAYAASCAIPLVLLYDGVVLIASEIAQVSRLVAIGNPFWAAHLSRTIYVPSAAGGFQPAWARNSNSIIQGSRL